MPASFFREAALKRLASPDQVDQPVRLVGIGAWLALTALLSGLAGLLVWAAIAEAPVKVSATGIIIGDKGLREIVANRQGRLKSLVLKQGLVVSAGQIVASFEHQELARELASAEAKLADVSERYDRLKSFYENRRVRYEAIEGDRLETIEETRSLIKERLDLLTEREQAMAELAKLKIVNRSNFIDAQLDLSNAKERLGKLDDDESEIFFDRQERLSEHRLRLLDEALKVKTQKRVVERLHKRRAEEGVIKSSHAGRVVEIMVNAGDVVASGKALATLTQVDGDTTGLQVVLYADAAEGKRIRPGMKVEISPTAFREEEYGRVLGEVSSIADLPATHEGMRLVLKNDQLVRDMSRSGAPFEIRVNLQTDPQTFSGYRWTASKGPSSDLNSGMLLNAKIEVSRVRLINIAIPQIDRFIDAGWLQLTGFLQSVSPTSVTAGK